MTSDGMSFVTARFPACIWSSAGVALRFAKGTQ